MIDKSNLKQARFLINEEANVLYEMANNGDKKAKKAVDHLDQALQHLSKAILEVGYMDV